METPKIVTAVPQRRYQFGDYQAVVLGEIESGDGTRYRYILALVREGDVRPELFVTCEPKSSSRAHEGRFRLRVISYYLNEELESSDRFGDIEVFSTEGLAVASRVLGLGDEQPVRLM